MGSFAFRFAIFSTKIQHSAFFFIIIINIDVSVYLSVFQLILQFLKLILHKPLLILKFIKLKPIIFIK
jgi:hypothetical protein